MTGGSKNWGGAERHRPLGEHEPVVQPLAHKGVRFAPRRAPQAHEDVKLGIPTPERIGSTFIDDWWGQTCNGKFLSLIHI